MEKVQKSARYAKVKVLRNIVSSSLVLCYVPSVKDRENFPFQRVMTHQKNGVLMDPNLIFEEENCYDQIRFSKFVFEFTGEIWKI